MTSKENREDLMQKEYVIEQKEKKRKKKKIRVRVRLTRISTSRKAMAG